MEHNSIFFKSASIFKDENYKEGMKHEEILSKILINALYRNYDVEFAKAKEAIYSQINKHEEILFLTNAVHKNQLARAIEDYLQGLSLKHESKPNVAIICGGDTAEKNISLRTGSNIYT